MPEAVNETKLLAGTMHYEWRVFLEVELRP